MGAFKRFAEGTAHGVRNSVQLYVDSEFANQLIFPLRQGDPYRAQIVAGGNALLVWRKGSPPDYPVKVPEPDVEEMPWPAPEHDPDLNVAEGGDTADGAAGRDSEPDTAFDFNASTDAERDSQKTSDTTPTVSHE